MTRDPLTDPQPGDVVRARDAEGVAVISVVARDGDEVTLRLQSVERGCGVRTRTEPVAVWADWTEWQSVTAIPAEAP